MHSVRVAIQNTFAASWPVAEATGTDAPRFHRIVAKGQKCNLETSNDFQADRRNSVQTNYNNNEPLK